MANVIIAPKAKIPARNSMSCGTARANAITAAMAIAT